MRRLAARSGIVVACIVASQTHGSSDEIKLGDLPRYASEGAARAACGNDPVVWADSHSGFFYPRFHSDFGKTPHGAFTCYGLAKKADYWSFTPEGDGGRQGREFPLMFCNLCS